MDLVAALVRIGAQVAAAVTVRRWRRRRARYGKHALGHQRDDQ